MSAQRAGRLWRVGDLIAAFLARGCEIKTIEDAEIFDPSGDVTNLREIVRPDTGAFVTLIDLTDDEWVGEDEVSFWERRLGLEVPRD